MRKSAIGSSNRRKRDLLPVSLESVNAARLSPIECPASGLHVSGVRFLSGRLAVQPQLPIPF
jgi:hypothetical protein